MTAFSSMGALGAGVAGPHEAGAGVAGPREAGTGATGMRAQRMRAAKIAIAEVWPVSDGPSV